MPPRGRSSFPYGRVLLLLWTFLLLLPGALSEIECPLRSCTCTDTANLSRTPLVTVVSGFWQIPNKYDSTGKIYHSFFNNSLRLNAPMVLFYGSSDSLSTLQEFRRGLPTCFVLFPIADLEHSFRRITQYSGPLDGKVGGYPAQLWLIWNSKVLLLFLAEKKNPFKTNFFAWMDAGINAFRNVSPPAEPWPAATKHAQLPTNSLIHSTVAADWASCFAGTAFIAHRLVLKRIAYLYYHKLMTECASDTLAAACRDDQAVFASLVQEQPRLFFSISRWHNHSAPVTARSCPVHCGWSCAITLLFKKRFECSDANLC